MDKLWKPNRESATKMSINNSKIEEIFPPHYVKPDDNEDTSGVEIGPTYIHI